MKYIVIICLLAAMVGCTAQQRAKEFGGNVVVELPKGKKLINATWKEGDLWYLMRDRNPNEAPGKYLLQESGSFGIMNGSVEFIEK